MREKRGIRIIKREAKSITDDPREPESNDRPAPTEREIKTVVSTWVQEHARRSDELRKSFAKLLSDVGFQPSRITGRA